ncbi:hypothetical protein [Nesterenkonia sp. NBAIMH1]|uniref:hypothetical protein n=1 Tax=Nesterenkonia sp. NBAIMH1 TaxID=2600320 RepID=UPI0011B75EAF|nr:hypothetical protein [Nesterenkonia sp. NBAIMH1]
MPDKPVETSWLRRRASPHLRRVKRGARRGMRQLRSSVRPQVGGLGPVHRTSPWRHLRDLAEGAAVPAIGLDLVLASAPEGETALPERFIDPLILAERRSIPTVMLVDSADDLEHPLAAVVTHMVTYRQELLGQVEAFAGEERTLLLGSAAPVRRQVRELLRLTRVHTRRG